MKIVNCCDHNVEICDTHGNIIKIYEPSGNWARVSHSIRIRHIDGVPTKVRENKKIVGLPEPEEGTMYIVSNILMAACPDRKDLLSCGAKKCDKYGRVMGWTTFQSNE